MGLGVEEARVRVRPLLEMTAIKNDLVKMAEEILRALLAKLGISASVESQAEAPEEGGKEIPASTTFNIKGDDLGILIGRRGQTLFCLQFIVRLIVAHKTKTWVPINIDVEGYKNRRYQALQALATRLAEQVRIKKVPFTLKPMLAAERRIIHLTLVEHHAVTTESVGEGEARRVVISPKGH